jgi:hypothetical protein
VIEPSPSAVRALLTASAVRSRAQQMLAAARAGRLAHFTLAEDKLDPLADRVVEVTRESYPDGAVPYHSRWRHFRVGDVDRFAHLYGAFGLSGAERGRARVELAIVSVLLDAGAGPQWRYTLLDGRTLGRSEGLAIASLDLVANGGFSTALREPWRVDAAVLQKIDAPLLGQAMQAAPDNPLVGLEGRAALLQALGRRIAERADLFGSPARLGQFFDVLAGRAAGGTLPAASILEAVLDAFNPIWPGRLSLAGIPLGDVWRHDAIAADDGTAGLMPFHKLSQWLAYSLVEPLEEAGIAVTDLDGLTGLAEYRNGGLFVDGGVAMPRDVDLARTFPVDSALVVEWRALTVALLDELAARMRARLGLDAAQLPLAKVLQGGTWAAGRQLAAERRPGGPPPFKVASDGTVF